MARVGGDLHDRANVIKWLVAVSGY
ncbi:MAG: hypothetical protein J07HR59_01164, partial [Halorubrum sp. J07HR59]